MPPSRLPLVLRRRESRPVSRRDDGASVGPGPRFELRLGLGLIVAVLASTGSAWAVAGAAPDPLALGSPSPPFTSASCPRVAWVSRHAWLTGDIWADLGAAWMVDLDGDGRDEILATTSSGGGGLLVTGAADARIGIPRFFPLPIESGGLIVGDLNRDGAPDAVVHDTLPGGVGGLAVGLLNDGTGTLEPAWTVELGSVVSRIDLHQRPDGTTSVLLAAGTGGLRDVRLDSSGVPAEDVLVSPEWTSHAVLVDLDGDGAGDLLSGRGGFAGSWRLRRGQPDGSWGPVELLLQFDIPAGSSISVVDVTGDGLDDLLTEAPQGIAAAARFWPNDPGGLLADPTVLTGERAAITPAAVHLVDVDADGFQDVLLVHTAGVGHPTRRGLIEVLRGDGVGGFVVSNWLPGTGRRIIASGDADGDGFVDLFTEQSSETASPIVEMRFGAPGSLPGQRFAMVGDRDDAVPVTRRVGSGSDVLSVHERTMQLERWAPPGGFVRLAELVLPIDASLEFDRMIGDAASGRAFLRYVNAPDMGSLVAVRVTPAGIEFASVISEDVADVPLDAGDVDGDGLSDLVFARLRSGVLPEVHVVSFASGAPATIATWNTIGEPVEAVIGDFDGDDAMDVVILTREMTTGVSRLEVAWGRPAGGVPHEPVDAVVVDFSDDVSIVITDWDGDGQPDAITGRNPWSLIRGLGDRRYEPVELSPAPLIATDLAALDVDEDGRMDLLSSASVVRQAWIGFGTTPAGAPATDVRSVYGPPGGSRATPADVDGDGRMDLIWVGGRQAGVTLARPCPRNPCLGDLDADGTVDFNDLLLLIGPVDADLGDPELIWDLDGDADRDSDDVAVLLAHWGACPAG